MIWTVNHWEGFWPNNTELLQQSDDNLPCEDHVSTPENRAATAKTPMLNGERWSHDYKTWTV